MIRKRNLWIKPLMVAIVIFPLSLFVDFLMGKELNYNYAFILAVIVGIIFFVLEHLMNYRIGKKISQKQII